VNRSKKFIHKGLAKKMHKEIRLAQSAYPVKEERAYSNKVKPNVLLKQYPKKKAKKINEQLMGFASSLQQRKKKRSPHHSKRTTPGELSTRNSAPAHVHPEGKRWIKTLVIQEKAKKFNKAK
jgi:hypothetical protein